MVRYLYHQVVEDALNRGEGLSFDDVLIKPTLSDLDPQELKVSGRFSPNIEAWISSSAMDTVTGVNAAKAMALEQGIGVLHRNNSPEEQADMVREVKRSGYVIHNPKTVGADYSLRDVCGMIDNFEFQTFPVVDDGGHLEGLITGSRIRLGKLTGKKTVEEIMIKNPIYVEPGVSREKAIELMDREGIEKLPVLDSKKRLQGLITLTDISRDREHRYANRDDEGRLKVAAAVGVVPGDAGRIGLLYNANVDALVIDSSHGYNESVIRTAKFIKENYGDAVDLVVGNFATREGAVYAADSVHGPIAVKVGIGPGSACTTREVTGVGVPQVTATYDVKVGLLNEGYEDVTVIADGGIKTSGDMAKLFTVGAGSVMVGGMLAGTDESPGEDVLYQGRKFKSYRGMGSAAVMKGIRHGYGRAIEGVEGLVPYAGKLSEVLREKRNGLKSAMAHVGVCNTLDMYKARLTRITSAGQSEGADLSVTLDRRPSYE